MSSLRPEDHHTFRNSSQQWAGYLRVHCLCEDLDEREEACSLDKHIVSIVRTTLATYPFELSFIPSASLSDLWAALNNAEITGILWISHGLATQRAVDCALVTADHCDAQKVFATTIGTHIKSTGLACCNVARTVQLLRECAPHVTWIVPTTPIAELSASIREVAA